MDKISNWVKVEERLPPERDSIFAKAVNTNKWNNAMFAKVSDDVNIAVKFKDNSVKVFTSYTTDGVWRNLPKFGEPIVTHWKPLPEPPKEGE